MKFLIAIAAAVCFIGGAAAQSCHFREIDLCAATLLLFNQGSGSIATTDEELNSQCGYIKEAVSCMGNFTKKCMTPLQRELVNFITEGSGDHLRDFCTEGTEVRNDFLKHSPCVRDAFNAPGESCLADLKGAIEFMVNLDRKQRIPAGCCLYQKIRGCTTRAIQEKCGDEPINLINDLINTIAADLPDSVCSNYAVGSASCDGLLPDPNAPPSRKKSNSVLSRLLSAYLGS